MSQDYAKPEYTPVQALKDNPADDTEAPKFFKRISATGAALVEATFGGGSATVDQGAAGTDPWLTKQSGVQVLLETTPLGAGATYTSAFIEVKDYASLIAAIASDTLGTASAEWSADGITVNSSTSTPFIGAGSFASHIEARYVRFKFVNGATPQTNFLFQIIGMSNAVSGFYFPVAGPIQPAFPALLTKSVLTGVKPDTTYGDVGLTDQNDLRIGFRAVLSSLNSIASVVLDAAGGPADEWIGTFEDVSNYTSIKVTASASGLIQGYQDWSTDGVTVHHSTTTPFAGAGSFHTPVEAQYVRVRAVNLAATPTTFTLETYFMPVATGPFLFPAGAPINATFPAMLGKNVITGLSRTAGYRDVRTSDTDGLVVRDERLSTTQSGSLFTEGITSHVSHIFSRDKGVEAISRMVQVSAAGTVTHDATEGRAVFATTAVAGQVSYFHTEKTLRYDEAAHMLRYELTGEIPQWPLVGTEQILVGAMEDDGAEGVLNGICHGMDSGGYFICRIKAGVLVSGTKVYSTAFNRNPLDAADVNNLFRKAGVPQAIDFTKNNYLLGSFEWLGVAPPTYGIQTPSGDPIVTHIEETPNNISGTIIQEPNIPIGIRIENDATSPRVLEFHIGSIRGGTHENKTVIQGQQPDGDFASTPADGLVFETDAALGAGGVFLSDWIDWDGWAVAEIVIVTDVPSALDGVEIEVTSDVEAVSPPVRFTIAKTYRPLDAARGYASVRVPVVLDGARIRFTNGASAQATFYMSLTLRTTFSGETDPVNRLVVGSGSEFERILARKVEADEEMRLDTEPTNTDHYIAVAADGTATTSAVWSVIRIYLSATKNPTRIRFREAVAWDSRTAGW